MTDWQVGVVTLGVLMLTGILGGIIETVIRKGAGR